MAHHRMECEWNRCQQQRRQSLELELELLLVSLQVEHATWSQPATTVNSVLQLQIARVKHFIFLMMHYILRDSSASMLLQVQH
jgi:hypothetical protein